MKMELKILVSVQILIICYCKLVFGSEELKANMNSYNVQMTTNTEGTMFKFRSPETDVQSTFKEPPKVDIRDALLPLAVITKAKGDLVLWNPAMSVAGNVKQPPAPFEHKEVHILEPTNRTEVAKRKFAKNRKNAYKILTLPKIESGVRRFNGIEVNSNLQSDLRNETPEMEASGDEENDEGSGDENNQVAENGNTSGQNILSFPPKAPEIPIELGVANTSSSVNKNDKSKQMANIQGRKNKPCKEVSCVEPTEEGKGGDDGKTDDEPPQPDIPIELGVVKNQPKENEYQVTYIDQKTPTNFILLEDEDAERKRKRRSVMGIKRSERHHKRKHHRRNHHHHRHLHQHHQNIKKSKHRSKKHRHNHHHRKRSGIMPYSYYYWNPQFWKAPERQWKATQREWKPSHKKIESQVEVQPIDKPVRAYLRTLAKDVRNVMGQAKQVLQSTGQVVHGLKRVLGGASILSSITSDAVKYAKYFNADVRNASLEYLQEKAIVALIRAEQSAKEAEEAATLARSASEKANAAERRMDIANSHQRSPELQKYVQFADLTKNQAIQANKAYKFASEQRDKTRKITQFLDKNLEKMSKFVGKDLHIESIEGKVASKIAAGSKVNMTESNANKKEDTPGSEPNSDPNGSTDPLAEDTIKENEDGSYEKTAKETESSSSSDAKPTEESNQDEQNSSKDEISDKTESAADSKSDDQKKDVKSSSTEETSNKPKGFLITQKKDDDQSSTVEDTSSSTQSSEEDQNENSEPNPSTEESKGNATTDPKPNELNSSPNEETTTTTTEKPKLAGDQPPVSKPKKEPVKEKAKETKVKEETKTSDEVKSTESDQSDSLKKENDSPKTVENEEAKTKSNQADSPKKENNTTTSPKKGEHGKTSTNKSSDIDSSKKEDNEGSSTKSSQIDYVKKEENETEEEESQLLKEEGKPGGKPQVIESAKKDDTKTKISNHTSPTKESANKTATPQIVVNKANEITQNDLISNNTTTSTITSSDNSSSISKKRIVERPIIQHHLIPGQYTGFKRDRISTRSNDDDTNTEDDREGAPIKRFKSIGTYKRPFVVDGAIVNSNYENQAAAFVKPFNESDASDDTPDNMLSGSGEATDEEAEEVAQLLKSPITVSVHVSKRKDKSTDISKEKHSEILVDPFGFKKHFPERKFKKDYVDPFGFKKFLRAQKQQETVANSRRNTIPQKQTLPLNDLDWD